MGNCGETVNSSLIAYGTANMVIAFEPAEAAGALKFLAPDGVLVTAQTGVQPVSSALAKQPYAAAGVVAELQQLLGDRLIVVDDAALTSQVGTKALNTILLASAVKTGKLPIDFDDLRAAIQACVKPRFVELNFGAISLVEAD